MGVINMLPSNTIPRAAVITSYSTSSTDYVPADITSRYANQNKFTIYADQDAVTTVCFGLLQPLTITLLKGNNGANGTDIIELSPGYWYKITMGKFILAGGYWHVESFKIEQYEFDTNTATTIYNENNIVQNQGNAAFYLVPVN